MAGYYREGLVNVQQFIISIVIIIVIIDNIIINRPILSFCICLNVGQCETEREREREIGISIGLIYGARRLGFYRRS